MFERNPLRMQVVEEVRKRILSGDLSPETRLSEPALATALGISRTPLREALMDLERHGLLTSEMGKGFAVSPLSSEEVREVLPILSTLHGLGLRIAGVPASDRIQELRLLNERIAKTDADTVKLYELDRKWHALLLEQCPNSELHEMIQSLDFRAMRYDLAYWRSAGNVNVSVSEHEAIICALEANDMNLAEERLVQHWMSSAAPLTKWLEEEPGLEA